MEEIELGNGPFNLLSKNSSRVIKMIGSMVDDEDIKDSVLEAERERVVDEQRDKPLSEIYAFQTKLSSLAWGSDHPYTLALDPGLETIRKLSKDDLKQAFDFLAGENLVISLVGKIENSEIAAVEKHFGSRRGPKVPDLPETHPFDKDVYLEQRIKELTTPAITVSYTLPGAGHPDMIITDMVVKYLNDPDILWRRLRDEKGLCYGIGAGTTRLSQSSSLYFIASSFDESRKENIIRALLEEAEKLKTGKIDSAALRRVKARNENGIINFERNIFSARRFIDEVFYGMPNSEERYLRSMTVNDADIAEFANKYFSKSLTAVTLPKK